MFRRTLVSFRAFPTKLLGNSGLSEFFCHTSVGIYRVALASSDHVLFDSDSALSLFAVTIERVVACKILLAHRTLPFARVVRRHMTRQRTSAKAGSDRFIAARIVACQSPLRVESGTGTALVLRGHPRIASYFR